MNIYNIVHKEIQWFCQATYICWCFLCQRKQFERIPNKTLHFYSIIRKIHNHYVFHFGSSADCFSQPNRKFCMTKSTEVYYCWRINIVWNIYVEDKNCILIHFHKLWPNVCLTRYFLELFIAKDSVFNPVLLVWSSRKDASINRCKRH